MEEGRSGAKLTPGLASFPLSVILIGEARSWPMPSGRVSAEVVSKLASAKTPRGRSFIL